jgi:hypothetical protein
MSHSLLTADRGTHLRIVAVSLACATVFVGGMIAARLTNLTPGVERAEAPVIIKAGEPVQWSNQRAPIVR